MRSLLFVPGDAPDKMQKALSCGADAIVLDLEDSVAVPKKAQARMHVAEFLKTRQKTSTVMIVRINPLEQPHGMADDDLDAVMPYAPDMIMLPKANGGKDVQWLGTKLSVHEAQHSLEDGQTRIIAIAPETPAAVFTLGTYQGASERLKALTWGGGEDLSAAVGAKTNRGDDGFHTAPYSLVRNLALFGAAAAQIEAVDGVYTNFRDGDGAREEALRAARDGFTGKLAIHPSQIAIYNDVFSPSAEEIEKAQAIIDAFSQAGDAGVVNFQGVMLDRPHLARAKTTLARAKNL